MAEKLPLTPEELLRLSKKPKVKYGVYSREKAPELKSPEIKNEVSANQPHSSSDSPSNEEKLPKFEISEEQISILDESIRTSKIPDDNPFSPEYVRPAPLAKEIVTDYECLDFENSVEFIAFFDSQVSRRERTLYEWQVQINLLMSDKRHSIEDPLELFVVAANGSGKDAYVISPIAVYFLCCRIRSRTVITTRDFKQMMGQTYPGIASFCEQVNKKLRAIGLVKEDEPDFIRIRQGHITCDKTGSEIIMFVTDEPGRAEGYHPWSDYAKSELTIIVNEAKNVEKEIFQALRRCTGFSRFICVSSAGFDSGYFYDNVCTSVNFPAPYDKSKAYVRFVTSYDCAHVSPKVIQKDKETLEPWLFGSIHESKFSSLGGLFIVPRQSLLKLKFQPNIHRDVSDICGGLDLSLGGDICKFYLRRGNKVVAEMEWQEKEPVILNRKIGTYLKGLKLPKRTPINVDAGGVGNSLAKTLRAENPFFQWNLITNQSPAFRKNVYRSKGTEDYFHVRTLVAFGLICALEDPELVNQLCSRRYILREQKLKVEDKQDHIQREGGSPDLADAFVLCFRNYKVHEAAGLLLKSQQEETVKDDAYTVYDINGNPITDENAKDQEAYSEEAELNPKSKFFNFYKYRDFQESLKNKKNGKVRSKSPAEILQKVYSARTKPENSHESRLRAFYNKYKN